MPAPPSDAADGRMRDSWIAREPLPPEPFAVLRDWLDEAFAAQAQPVPHAFTLATVDPDGRPSARTVLCKELELGRGALLFYTNLASRKARALAVHPHAAAVFHFGPHERQARIEGPVTPVSDAEADAYFASRPRAAQLGAWASAQSEPVASRPALEAQLARVEARFADAAAVPRPPHWGGFRLRALRVELWVGRTGRLHDRALWTREPAGATGRAGPWRVLRLQP